MENQRELNEAQIRMLQAQLNPHFLCNTLDTMKWISKINQVPQVAVMSTDLADILRFCISPDEFVPLRREVEILQRYMEIQSIRLSGRCRFEVALPPDLEACMVPKMILQPIVENAVLHAKGATEIELRVRREGGLARFSVLDNGAGIDPAVLPKLFEEMFPHAGELRGDGRRSMGIGLSVCMSIVRAHGGTMKAENRATGGACVSFALPMEEE